MLKQTVNLLPQLFHFILDVRAAEKLERGAVD